MPAKTINEATAGMHFVRARVINAALSIGALLMLAQAYEYVIMPVHTFGGFTLSEPNVSFALVAVAIGGTAALALPPTAVLPGDMFIWLQFALLVIPAGVLVSMGGAISATFWLTLLSTAAAQATRSFFSRRSNRPEQPATGGTGQRKLEDSEEPPTDPRPEPLVVRTSWAALLAIVISLVISVGGAWSIDLDEVYTMREQAMGALSPAMHYLLPLGGMALLPFLVAVALRSRRYGQMVALACIGVLIFAFSSHKAMAFYPIAALAGWVTAKGTNSHRWILVTISTVCAVGLGLSSMGGAAVWVTGLSVHRVLFLPIQIVNGYIDYFSLHPFLLWAESKVTLGLLSSGLDTDAASRIGAELFGRDDVVANSGWIATGFMNGGIFGLALYAIAVGYLYAWIDMYATRGGRRFIVGAFLVPVATMILSADLLTTVLTHGLGMTVILTYLYLRAAPPVST